MLNVVSCPVSWWILVPVAKIWMVQVSVAAWLWSICIEDSPFLWPSLWVMLIILSTSVLGSTVCSQTQTRSVYYLPNGLPMLPWRWANSCLLLYAIGFSLSNTIGESFWEFRGIFVNQELHGTSDNGRERKVVLTGVNVTFSCNTRPATLLNRTFLSEEWGLLGPSLVSHWVQVANSKMRGSG